MPRIVYDSKNVLVVVAVQAERVSAQSNFLGGFSGFLFERFNFFLLFFQLFLLFFFSFVVIFLGLSVYNGFLSIFFLRFFASFFSLLLNFAQFFAVKSCGSEPVREKNLRTCMIETYLFSLLISLRVSKSPMIASRVALEFMASSHKN
jgi:hypothetical protein